MADYQNTLLTIVNHMLNQHPSLAPQIEQLSAYMQGKGYGATTIEQENNLVLQALNRPPKLAIDIGGNVGDYSAELRRRNPGLEIHTFEPSAVNISKLTKRFVSDSKISILPFAVSDKTGSAILYSNVAGSDLGSLTQRKLEHLNINFDVQESIKTIRFEDYWNAQLHRRPLDIVKIDVEGHELSSLQGFGEAILSTKVLQFEFGGCNVDTRTYFRDFWHFFKDLSFEIYRITPLGAESVKKYKESDEFFSTTNYIAVNNKIE